MNTILLPLLMVALLLSAVAIAETSAQDSNQLLRDYQAAELRYQEAAKIYRTLRRDVRSDPMLKEVMFGSSRSTTGLRLAPVPEGSQGVRVRSVMPGSLAEQAGLRAEDVIMAVDDERFHDLRGSRAAMQMMTKVLSRVDAGTSVRIEYLRAGEINFTDTRTQTSAEIAQLQGSMLNDGNTGNPANQSRAPRDRTRQLSTTLNGGAVIHWSGLTFVNMTRGLGPYFGVETGVLLVHSDESLPLMEGDVILKIGQQALVNASQAVSLLQGYDPDETMTLEIWRHGRSILLESTFNPSPLPGEQVAQETLTTHAIREYDNAIE